MGFLPMTPPPLSIRAILREMGHWLAGSPHSRLRQRAQLRALDERLLADIGVTRSEAIRGRSSAERALLLGATAAAGAVGRPARARMGGAGRRGHPP